MTLVRSEAELLAALRSRFGSAAPAIEVGIGDDAAVVRFEGPRQVVSVDLFVDGVDFPPGTQPEFFARKSLAASLSDVFACGARPTLALVALGIPPSADDQEVDRFFSALDEAARRFRCPIGGGDLSRAPAWTISVTAWGAPVGEPWLRRGASLGDDIWYFGSPAGRAAAGLRLLLAGAEARSDGAIRVPVDWDLDRDEETAVADALFGQLSPEPFIFAPELAQAGGITSAIDTSDGLLLDATRLADASGVGIELDVDSIALFHLPEKIEKLLGRDPLADGLSGGEDFAVVATAKPDAATRWPAAASGWGRRIGKVVAGRGARVIVGGRELHLPRLGWDHFATNGSHPA